MNKKIVGMFVCTLLIATIVLPVTSTKNVDETKLVETSVDTNNEAFEIQNKGGPVAHIGPWCWLPDCDWDYWTDSDLLYTHELTDKVGIGTNNPLVKLHVVGGQIEIDEDLQNSRWQIHGSSFAFGIKDEDQNEYRLIIKNDNGKVGISTFSPTSRLHVEGPIATAITTVIVPPDYYITEDDSVIFAKTPNTQGFVYLPQSGLSPGREYKIKNIGDTGIIWVVPTSGDGIDYWPEFGLWPMDSIIVVSDGDPTGTGGQWFILAQYDY